MRFSPALASVILIFGFAGGVGATYELLWAAPNPGIRNFKSPQAITPAEASIAGIDSITPVPGTDQVSIKYNTVSTQETHGSLNDQQIQQLLLYAARNNYNSGVRVDSVDCWHRRAATCRCAKR